MFLRRGVSGVPELDVHVLELTNDGWLVLGGGGGPGEWHLPPALAWLTWDLRR